MYYKQITVNENSENIYSKIGKNDSLMSKDDHDFLCGLLNEYKPKKILEVGVYAGGTTIAILDCMQKIGAVEMYSVDLAIDLDNGKKAGYLVEEAKPYLNNISHHHMYVGVTAPEIIEDLIKDGRLFDFVIIDTVHYLPGEILDFLAVFPFLTENAIVVLHDVMLNHMGKCRTEATKVVFDVAVGKKNWNWNSSTYPNIAAIQITNDTGKYISDLISALSISWHQNPGMKCISQYRKIIEKYYSAENLQLFDKVIRLSLDWWNETLACKKKVITQLIESLGCGRRRLWIFGTGRGTYYLSILKAMDLEKYVAGFLISDEYEIEEKEIEGKPIYRLSEIQYTCDRDAVILSTDNKEVVDLLGRNKIFYITLEGIIAQTIFLFANPMQEY